MSDTPLFTADIVLLSVMNRSLDLIEGFVWAYDRWNLSTAAPIVRMQVDNLLRLSLLLKADVGSGVPELLLSGEPLRTHRDPLSSGTKQKLTDKRLRDHARATFPWLDQVYEKASGWVHFSSVHVGVTMALAEDGQVLGRFPSDIDRYPYDFLEQVLWAMNESTSGLIQVVTTFADGKAEAARGWSDAP